MQEFLIVALVLFLLFGVIRRFIFFNAYNAFNKAAEDFYKRQEEQEKIRRKREGKVTITGRSKSDQGEYVDYEEVK